MKGITRLFFVALCSTGIFAQDETATIRINDLAFEEALIDLGLDSNGLTGDILVSDTEYITHLDLNTPLNNPKLPNTNSKIKSLAGIEHFTNLKRLDCIGNDITNIDLSNNTQLNFLNCSDNKLIDLDLINNNELISVSCDANKILNLTLGKQANLVDLYANNNLIETLDVTGCDALQNVDLTNNKIDFIYVSDYISVDAWYKDQSATYKQLSKEEQEENANDLSILNAQALDRVTKAAAAKEQTPKKAVTQRKKVVITNKPKVTTTSATLTKTESKAVVNPTNNTGYSKDFINNVVKEFEDKVLEEARLQKIKFELINKHDLKPSDLNKWIKTHGKQIKINN